jgi:glycerol-3-phosphate dehydrogenase (NAD(P)+)
MVGPSIARELTRQSPTAVNLSTTADEQQTRKLANAFSSQHFSVEPCQDLKGLEICAAFKNIYSIALSWPLGLGQEGKGEKNGPTNLKAILLLQALDELEQIIRAAGGRPETAHGLAGLGDLVATAGSGRNGSFGKLLGSGQTTAEAMKTLQNQGIHTVEGFDATPQGLRYVETLKSLDSQSLPLLSAIGEVIEGTISPQSFVSEMNLKQYTGHTKYD